MRLGGPTFSEATDPKELVEIHQKLGFGAAFAGYIEDPGRRAEHVAAFKEADIVLAEYGSYCINILDTDPKVRAQNIATISENLRRADEMGVRCCVIHGGSVETGGWGFANPENMSQASFDTTVKIVQGILDDVQPTTTKLVMETESYLLPDGPDEYLALLKAIDRKSFAVHFDPVNITSSPRRFYFSGDFLKQCFATLGEWIVSCHAKDTNIVDHASVQLTETFVGDGKLDYDTYLTGITKLSSTPTLMIEHLSGAQMKQGLEFLFAKASELGIVFEGSDKRDPSYLDNASDEYFAPHIE
jgi:sugar phosphate isomerase/epimerase